MASREELYQALRNADAAGDVAAAQKLAAYIQSMPAVAAPSIAPTPQPAKTGMLRAAADIPVQVGRGIAQGVKAFSDAFGTDNPVSRAASGVEGYLGELLSAQAQNNQAEISRIMKEAEDKGVGAQVAAAAKAIATAPVDTISQVFGTAVPVIAGGLVGSLTRLGASAVGYGIGATMGAGTVKGSIYEAVKQELKANNVPEAEAERRAQEAQAYGGENIEQILLGAGLGAAASRGAERIITDLIKKGAMKPSALPAATRIPTAAVTEALPEAAQAAQERIAQNIALQREGYDVPTMRGVAGQAAFEGLAGAGLGAIAGAAQRTEAAKPEAEAPKPAAPAEPEMAEAEAPKPVTGEAGIVRPEEETPISRAVAEEAKPEIEPTRQIKSAELMSPPTPQEISQSVASTEQDVPSEGMVRMYHGGRGPEELTGPVWFTLDRRNAEGWAKRDPSMNVWYVDVPERALVEQYGYSTIKQAREDGFVPVPNLELPEDFAKNRKPLPLAEKKTPVPAGVEEGRAIRPEAGVEPSITEDRERAEPEVEAVPEPVVAEEVTPTAEAVVPESKTPTGQPAGWVLRNKETGEAVMETNDPATVRALNTEKYEAVPILEYLQGLNKPQKPAAEALPQVEIAEPTEPSAKPNELSDYQRRLKEYWGNQVNPVIDKYLRAIDRFGIDRLEKNQIKPVGVSAREWLESFVRKQSTWEKGRKTGQTGIQILSIKNLWPTTDNSGEQLRKAMLDAVKALKNAPGSNSDLMDEAFKEKRKSLRATPAQQVSDFEQTLRTALNKFGLKDVGVKLIDGMREEGSYAQQLIRIAADAANPIRTLRHEAIHALRELGFFTPQQWQSLSKMTKDKWIDQYLKQRNVDGKPLKAGEESRYDAYMREYEGDMEKITEEAVADAFADFDATKPPAGLMASLLTRLRNLFQAIKSALTKVESPEQIFGKVERGELVAGAREKGKEAKSVRASRSLVGNKGEKIEIPQGYIDVQHTFDGPKPPSSASVVDFQVEEGQRGRGYGKQLIESALKKYPDLGAQVSSVASLKAFYEKGFRNPSIPNGTLQDHINLFEDNVGSVYLRSKDGQKFSLRKEEAKPTPTTAGKQALDTINQLGMGVKPPEPNLLEKAKNKLERIGEAPAKETMKKWQQALSDLAANLDGKLFSADAPFENKIRQGRRQDFKGLKEFIGTMLTVSQSQAVASDAVATQAMLIGKVEYRKDLYKWVAVKDEANDVKKAEILDRIAAKYGLTKEEAIRVAHTYLSAANYEGILERNAANKALKDKARAEARKLDAEIVKLNAEYQKRMDDQREQAEKKIAELQGKIKDLKAEEGNEVEIEELKDQIKELRKEREPGKLITELKKRIKELREKNEEQNKEIDRISAAEVFVTPEQAAMVQPGLAIADQIPEVKEITTLWNRQRENVKNVLVETGLWTREYAEAMMDNAAYVPFYREMEDEVDASPEIMIRGLQVKAKEHKLKGSSAPVADVFENMARWQQYALNRAMRNHKALQMIDAATEMKLGDKPMAVKVSDPGRGKNITRVWRDGKQEYYEMADPLFVDAFKSLGAVSIPAVKWFTAIANRLREFVVLYPLFSVAQLPQDAVAAIFASGLKPRYAFKIPYLAVKQAISTYRGTNKLHNELKNFGVVGVRDFNAAVMRQDAEIMAGIKMPLGGAAKVKFILERIAMSADNAVRQAVYQASMDQPGVSQAEALEKAFEIINFRRRGSSKILNLIGQTVPFFYAYLSAQRVAYKTITGTGISPGERKAAIETLIYTSGAVMALSFIYAMANGDDEAYEKTPTNIRDRSINIPGTNGFRIPLRPDFFLFPKIIAEHTYHLMAENGFSDPAKFKRAMADNLANAALSPNVVPQAFKPALEIGINYSFFEGRPIVGFFEQNKEAGRQFNESTSEFAKMMGGTGLSPQKVDHFIRGYFGSVGGLFLYATNFFIQGEPGVERPAMTFEDAIKTVPGVGALKQKPTENALKVDFYELRDAVAKAKNTFDDIKLRSPEGLKDFIENEENYAKLALEKRVTRVADELSKIRRAIQQVAAAPEGRYSAEEKQARIKELRDIELKLLRAVDVKGMREKAMM